MKKTDKLLKVIGIMSIGAFASRMFNSYIIPILDIDVSRVQNRFTKESTELQQELYKLQTNDSGQIQEPCIGFDLNVEPEEYEDDF